MNILFIIFIYLCFCLFTTCMQYPKRPEEGVGSSGTGVQRIVRHPVVLGIKPRSSGRAARALTHCAIILAPRQTFFLKLNSVFYGLTN